MMNCDLTLPTYDVHLKSEISKIISKNLRHSWSFVKKWLFQHRSTAPVLPSPWQFAWCLSCPRVEHQAHRPHAKHWHLGWNKSMKYIYIIYMMAHGLLLTSIRTFHTEKHPGKAPFAHFFSHPKRSRRRCRSSSPVALVGSVCVFFPINRVDVSLTFFAWAPNMVSCSTPRLMHGFNLSHFILQVDLFHQTFVWNQIASEAQRTSRWVILSDFVLLNLQGKHVWMKCIEMYWTVAIVFVWKWQNVCFFVEAESRWGHSSLEMSDLHDKRTSVLTFTTMTTRQSRLNVGLTLATRNWSKRKMWSIRSTNILSTIL